jgi:hypothetical protein
LFLILKEETVCLIVWGFKVIGSWDDGKGVNFLYITVVVFHGVEKCLF